MADSATKSAEQVDKITLRLMVDKENKKVLYAEAGKDFYDVLFSFLTLPLGTIARLVAEDSNIEAVRFGSISSLYQSVSDLDEQYLWSKTCKDMLLNPRNSMEGYCGKLKLNIDDTEPMKRFICSKLDCICIKEKSGNHLSTFRNQKCSCGEVMNIVISQPQEYLSLENGLVKETATFIISDDLSIMPNVFGTVVHLLQKLKITNIEAIVEQTVDISKIEVVDFLKLSLISKTPLTDFIFKKNDLRIEFDDRNQFETKNGEELTSGEGSQMSVKVLRKKSTGEILFVEGGVDFIDFIFSFLTFPLGGVLHMFEGLSPLSCINNLYRSMTELSPDTYLMSKKLKDQLTKPLIAAQFELNTQTLPISAANLPVYYCNFCYTTQWIRTLTSTPKYCSSISDHRSVLLNFVDPKFSASKSSSCGEFAKGPLLYMVTDDLVVTPMSSFSAISHLNSSNIPLFDVEERIVRIGLKEGLSILKASLTSTSAFTNGLNQFITASYTTIKEEI